MPQKEFLCKTCGDVHKTPINSKCTFVNTMDSELESQTEHSPSGSGLTSQVVESDLNLQILSELLKVCVWQDECHRAENV